MPTLRLIDTRAEFEALERSWNALLANDDRPGAVFRSFAWHRIWLDHFGPADADSGSGLAIVVESEAGLDTLIVPLVRQRSLGIIRLELMGSPVSQYGDVIGRAAPDLDQRISAALSFAAEKSGADLISLSRIRSDSLAAGLLEAQPNLRIQRQSAPYIELGGYRNAEAFLATQSKTARKQRRRLRRRLEEQGPVELDYSPAGNMARAHARRIVELKARNLVEKGILSRAFANSQMADFFCAAASPGSGIDIRVAVMLRGDDLVAADIGFREGQRYLAHIGVFNPAYQKFAVGHLLHEDVLRACMAEGLHTYDFLAPADTYKLGWANASIDVCDYAISYTAVGRLHRAAILKHALPAIKWGQKQLPRPVRQLAVRLLHQLKHRTADAGSANLAALLVSV